MTPPTFLKAATWSSSHRRPGTQRQRILAESAVP
jgi:hypothetical protein